jgi:hypothetical protein
MRIEFCARDENQGTPIALIAPIPLMERELHAKLVIDFQRSS